MSAENTGKFTCLDVSGNKADGIRSLSGSCALEDSDFPFEHISDIAEMESWRKEINRPVYHIHKWWARRLGSVFRAMAIGALTPSGTDILDIFYEPARFEDFVVFDPFMGSGTSVGEAVKLGARAIGRDINPVAHFLVKNALSFHDPREVLLTFREIEQDVAQDLRYYYKSASVGGQPTDVLYFFWVKTVECPECARAVDLWPSRIFARHAYPKRFPEARAVCPACGDINVLRYDDQRTSCDSCGHGFDPQAGSVNGKNATCPACSHTFSVVKAVRDSNIPPPHRLYAKLVLLPDGKKAYEPATDEDRTLFAKASEELSNRPDAYPVVPIEPGYNTNQVLGYNYRYWHEMFNDRQLLCLSILAERIRSIPDEPLRDLFTCLFSGVLEFNNMFASYKGEGTGAVRHMFAHHILKPEKVPLEANVWGTAKSSGSFMTIFERRICRALDYASNPFELRLRRRNGKKRSEKVYGLSEKLGFDLADDYGEFVSGRRVYLSCGDSSETDLDDKSVDVILTDPPFFDNVHYSQLADFFHVWQRYILGASGHLRTCTTRSDAEVQNTDQTVFTERLAGVWTESHRVLKDEGVLVFTYHHSRPEGWRSVLCALMKAGFRISAAHPIKAEMSVAVPKRKTREPIDLDIILVCRKFSEWAVRKLDDNFRVAVTPMMEEQIRRLRATGRHLSRNDVRIIVMAQILKQLSVSQDIEKAVSFLESAGSKVEKIIQMLYSEKTDKVGVGKG